MAGDDGRGSQGWREQLAPLQEDRDSSNSESDGSTEYESDWEAEVNAKGEVFYVVPVAEKELASFNTRKEEKKEKKEKKGNKLSRLVRRRESKRDRNISSITRHLSNASQAQNESSDGDSSTYGQIKTFESFFEGTNPVELTDVHIRLTAAKVKGEHEFGLSLLEETLGIIPGRSEQPTEDAPFTANRVIIAGFITDGPAIKQHDKLKIGDWLRTIDGQQVTLDNIAGVLSRYSSSCKVKLTVQRAANISQLVEEDDQLITPPTVIKIVTGQGPSPGDVQGMLKKLPYIALYTTRRGITETSPELADVLYQFPAQQQSKLLQVRGMFLTLCHALPEITGSKPITSSLLVEEELVHVGYAEEREDLFIMALPASKCSAKEVSQIVRDIVRVLRLQYKTLARAFTQKNTGNLNEFFSIQFLDILVNIQKLNAHSKPLLDVSTVLSATPAKFDQNLPAAHWLHLPEDVKFQIDDALSQFEAGDFQEYSDEFYDLPREFNILGTCLFHKGYLLSSHLCRDDMVDVLLWCQFHQILPLIRAHPVHQIINWSEVFPTRQSLNQAATEDSENRVFLLIVGLGSQVLGVLLETGGCAVVPQGVVRPDPFYVDQAINTLEHLIEMGIPSVCNKWLTLPANPDIVNIDSLYEAAQTQKRLDASTLGAAGKEDKRMSGKGIILKKTRSYEYASTESPSESLDDNVSLPQSQSDGNSEVSDDFREDKTQEDKRGLGNRSWEEDRRNSSNCSPVSEDESSFWELYRSGQRSQLNFSDDLGQGIEEEDIVHYQVSQLSVSPDNTIFHFLHLDVGEGVFLAPLVAPSGSFHGQVLDNFRSACQIIHTTFQMTIRSKDLVKGREAGQTPPQRPWLNKSLVAVKEQGMLFHFSPNEDEESPKKQLPVLSYWVAGRLFLSPHPRECYVCYHDSAPQVMIELAFRLAFGVHL